MDQARQILAAGAQAGLGTRIHANQLQQGGGIALGVEMGVASCDHCTHVSDHDVELLAGARDTTVATLLPNEALLADYSFNSKVDQAYVDDMAAIVGFLKATNRIPGQPIDALTYTYTAPLKAVDPALVAVEGRWRP